MTMFIVLQLAGLLSGDAHRYAYLSLSVVLFGAALFGLLWLDWRSNPWRWRRHTPRHRRDVETWRLVAALWGRS